jgi:NAD(P)-dependent dehydrogenase (short-subunit alcohol dehydrogenase family)
VADTAPDLGLTGRVAVVAGATRGAGRGIAAALGERGATVVCTGRSSSRGGMPSDYAGRSETIEETAALVSELGGVGVAYQCDHLDQPQVELLAAAIRKDFGRLDVLVNDIWGGELLKGPPPMWDKPLWEVDLDDGLRILRLAVETHLRTSHALLPLLVEQPGGLVVEINDGTAAYNAAHYRISMFYDLAKTAVNRLAWAQGHELGPFGATALAVTPGFLRSEMMLEAFGVTEDNWRDALADRRDDLPTAPAEFALSETPRFVGRGIAALASDPDKERWNQQSVDAAELARVYGVTDLDGSRPDCWRYIHDHVEHGTRGDLSQYR